MKEATVTDEMISLQKMQVVSWVYLLVITIGSYFFLSWSFAWSAFAGGVISIISFQVAHKDVLGFVNSLIDTTDGMEEDQKKQVVKQGKLGFMLKFWFRIVIIGVVLLVLIKSEKVDIFGLILGLSTVVFTVTFSALSVARHYFIRRR